MTASWVAAAVCATLLALLLLGLCRAAGRPHPQQPTTRDNYKEAA